MRIDEQLDDIVKYLSELGFPIKEKLCSPLSDHDIYSNFDKTEFDPPNELISIYEWHNGIVADSSVILDEIQLFPGFYFLKLEDAIEKYLLFKNDPNWQKSWFPIFANGGGDFYVMDFSEEVNGFHPIIGFVLGEEYQDIEFNSLKDMINTYYLACKSGVIYKAEGRYLEQDDGRFIELAQRTNPDVSYWYG